ncbi:MAG: type 4a pilus biogenesis protein PilO [Nitrospirae bacterium]|nr:type 4a pilus biogenesis protein PilO [Nitrospirota bacterium]
MALNINFSISSIPVYQRLVIFALLLVFCVGGFIYIIYLPKQEQLMVLKKQIAELEGNIHTNQALADKLPQLKEEKEKAETQLITLQQELPAEAEMVALLKQIAELGVKSGLDFKLWKPGASRAGRDGLYVEFPVNVEVAGGYHALAGFFDQIGHLQRIVNVTNLKMGSAKASQADVDIQTVFVATAFAAGQEPAPAASKPKAGAKPAAKPADKKRSDE